MVVSVTGTGADGPRCRVTSWRRLPGCPTGLSESNRSFKKTKVFACEPEGTLYYDLVLYLQYKLRDSERFCFLVFFPAPPLAAPAPAIR